MLITLLIIIFYPLLSYSLSFGSSKATLNEAYLWRGRTFYCNCKFQKKSIDHKSCKVLYKKYKKRKYRLEWEHIVPAHAFGQSFKEWRNNKTLCFDKKTKKYKSPRKCAKTNPKFRAMESDLFNLYPSVGSINAVRSNYSMSMLPKDSMLLCDKGPRLADRKFEPPDNLKGDIARIYMYMDNQYPGHGIVSNKNKKLFLAWAKLDPVDKFECKNYKLRSKLMKRSIKELEEKCQKF